MDRFSKLHPTVQILFYLLTFGIVLTINDPVFSAICFVSGAVYGAKVKGRAIFSTLKFSLLLLVFVSFFNMLFAHYGEDVLFRIKDTEFTAEALFYGFNQGIILCSVLLWFDLFSRTVDSEKIIYVFRFAPKLALLFSMVLGFVPRFTKKLRDIRDAQLGLNNGVPPKGVTDKLKQALSVFSSLVTYSLESSIITADSMEARGFNPRAVRPSRYKYCINDFMATIIILLMSAVVVVAKIKGSLLFVFDPKIYYEAYSIPAFVCFAILQLMPIIIDFEEDVLWKMSSAKT